MNFDQWFSALTEHTPFPWQKRLYNKFCNGDIPAVCDIPTGLGKTSVIAIWLLAHAGRKPGVQIPRRLVYVVNRRTIVDQSSEVAIKLCSKLKGASRDVSSPLHEAAVALANLCAFPNHHGELLSVSTLRGELADNLQWRHDPMRPAIMIGTVDMIGSKLLFSGYGDTRRTRPLNAGLVGCDTLIVHDEAHLTPAFSLLLRSIENYYNDDNNGGPKTPGIPPFRVLELSATSRRTQENTFEIDASDRTEREIEKRLFAKKTLHLRELAESADPLEPIVDLALEHSANRTKVVVFVKSPEHAAEIHERLTKALMNQAEESWRNEHSGSAMTKKDREELQRQCKASVSILTGEIRGHERDRLLGKPGMIPFLSKSAVERTVYLISTSAGEVGMDLHADHMVSDLTTLDSMIQRLGRVNRFGHTESRVDVVHDVALKKQEHQRKGGEPGPENESRDKTALRNTLALFLKSENQETGVNICPSALLELLKEKNAHEAFAPEPESLVTTDILLDLWSQTSFADLPAKPEVAPWLHGIQTDLPETWMAWRQEVSLLGDSDLSDDEVSLWFQKLPISSRETLRKPTFLLKWTGKAEKKWVELHKDVVVFILSSSGQCRRMTIGQLAEQGPRLGFATIVFPTRMGGLSDNGFFDIRSERPVQDVADDTVHRVVLQRRGDRYRFVPINDWCAQPQPMEPVEPASVEAWFSWTSLKDAVRVVENTLKKKAVLKLKIRRTLEWEDDIHDQWLLLLKGLSTGSHSSKTGDDRIPTIDEHNRAVAETIGAITKITALPESIKEALRLAALNHDLGKAHARWQTAAGHDPNACLAKPAPGGMDWRILDGYRHESGSVLQATEVDAIRQHAERDLILHLIATHHGWARPHFEDKAFPPDTDEETRARTGLDVMTRFIRLQERFGYWQLAWLESLLRRADGIASMMQGAFEEASDE